MKHTLVLSDIHLSQAHPEDPGDPLWMRYRRREHHPDADFAKLVDHVLASTPHDPIELVFNGDIFDFDSPWVKNGESSFDEFPPTDAGCSEHARLIMTDHEGFFGAAAKLLARGHDVTFLSGNHDIELYWPGVRRTIREELGRLLRNGAGGGGANVDVDLERVRFRTWFHITSDRIYLEHGSQYDIHNAVRSAAVPLTKTNDRIHPVLGKLAFRRTGARMGYFNPYHEETFYMGLFGYLGHFASFYARSRRHIVRTWFGGAMSTVGEILRHRHRDERITESRAAVRSELGAEITDEAIDRTHALRAQLAEDTMIPILRELWLDRVFLAFGCLVIALLTLLVSGVKAAAIAIGIELVLFVLYEIFTPKPDVRTYDSAPESVLGLFDIHGVRAVCVGHTHRPFTRQGDKGLYANSGSWCPAFEDQACTKPVLDGRPVIWLSTTSNELSSALYGGLFWWRGEALVPDANAKLPPNAACKPLREKPEHAA